jgi:hypothetical protein
MRRVPVKSSALRSVGYHDASAMLDIELVTGRVYRYFDVPWETYQALMESPSKGWYYNTRIKPGYSFEEIDDRATPSCSRAASRSRQRKIRRH